MACHPSAERVPGSPVLDMESMELSFEQARVLGALIEKQMTTPDYYPMTVNALVAACNQKNNREPVTSFDESDVERILTELTDLGLTRFTRASGSRTLKYVHKAPDVLEVDEEQVAILAIMLLRGPQTIAELKTRTERYIDFADAAHVEERVRDLMTRDDPLVVESERMPGRRETRYETVLVDHPLSAPSASLDPRPAAPSRSELEERVATLERTVARIVDELGME